MMKTTLRFFSVVMVLCMSHLLAVAELLPEIDAGWNAQAAGNGKGQATLTIGPVVRGAGLPNSVSPGETKAVKVTFPPGLANTEVKFVIVGGSADNGTAVFVNALGDGSVHRSNSGTITVQGGNQTAPGNPPGSNAAHLFIKAYKLDGTYLGKSPGFSVCAHPYAVQNGPGHTPYNTIDQAGMDIDIVIKSDSGTNSDLNQVMDDEVVSASYSHTGSLFTTAAITGYTTDFQIASTVAGDTHATGKAYIIDKFDNHGGAGSWRKGQLDRFYCNRCGMVEAGAKVITTSGYEVLREILAPGGAKIDFQVTKSAKSVSVGGYSSGAGPSATQHDKVTVRN
jgi:hypothetical protein